MQNEITPPTEKKKRRTKQPTAATPSKNVHPIKAIRRAGVSLCAIETPDPVATMNAIAEAFNGKEAETAFLQWDIVTGLRAWYSPRTGKPSQPAVAWLAEAELEPIRTTNPVECLAAIAQPDNGKPFLPEGSVVYFLGTPRALQDGAQYNPGLCQAIWNLRDPFKARGCTLIMLGAAFTLPPELSRDIILITEELPDHGQLSQVITTTCGDAGITVPDGEPREAIIDTLLGLSAFEAEQALALSITATGIDRADLWRRKVKAIEATDGLTVYRGKEKLEDVAGNENGKTLMRNTMSGPLDPSCIVFIDEIDKGMAAANTDTSGTTQDQNKVLLSYMQDNDIIGSLFLGPPGTGKTLMAKALANEFGVPLIMLDLGALKGSLVGQSEQNARRALKIIHAISGGRALFLGACNRDAGLPPELRRRFSFQMLFFDLPDKTERAAAWKVHSCNLKLRGETVTIPPEHLTLPPDDEGWTGAEIRNACLKSYAMGIPITEAAKTIVPISKSAGDIVLALRKAATGRYISASKPEIYTYREKDQTPTARRMGE